MLSSCLYVGAGGFIGAVFRFLVGRSLLYYAPASLVPLGTLTANLTGCLLIGFIAGKLATIHPHRTEAELFLITGLLGGFTTFSAFGFECITMLRRGDYLDCGLYIAISIIGGLLLTVLGWWIACQPGRT